MNKIAPPVTVDSARELLTAVVRVPFELDKGRLLRLATDVDWDAAMALAKEHRLLPLLFSRFLENDLRTPSEVRELLRREYERNAFHGIANARELLSVLAEFEALNIPALPFKGVVLAASIYQNLTTRPAGDLDLLIFERDVARASTVLTNRGYRLTTEIHADGLPAAENYYEYHFERPADGMVLELRWRLEVAQPRFRHNLGMEWLWPKRRTAKLAGVDVPDMDPESALLVLCMHGSKHVWSRLIWVCDVAQLIAAEPALDWQAAAQEAKRVGLWRCLALGALLAQRICGANVPIKSLRDFESDAPARRLAAHLQKHLFDRPGMTLDGAMPYSVQLLGTADRLRFLLSPDFLRPNARDRAAIALPKPLHFFYYFIRPIRLLLDRSAR